MLLQSARRIRFSFLSSSVAFSSKFGQPSQSHLLLRHFRDSKTEQEVLDKYISKIESKLGLQREKITKEELRKIVKQTQEAQRQNVSDSDQQQQQHSDTQINPNTNTKPPSEVPNQLKKTNKTHLNLPPSVKTLDDILNMEMIKNESAEKIGELWKQFHSTKDCVHAVIPAKLYQSLYQTSKQYPKFVYPLPVPRSQEIILVWAEFQGHQCAFTQLSEFRKNRENARAILTISHYTELQEEKGIVLMVGEYDVEAIDMSQAQCLAHQLQMYYLDPKAEALNILRTFNHHPDQYDYRQSITALEKLYDKSLSALEIINTK